MILSRFLLTLLVCHSYSNHIVGASEKRVEKKHRYLSAPRGIESYSLSDIDSSSANDVTQGYENQHDNQHAGREFISQSTTPSFLDDRHTQDHSTNSQSSQSSSSPTSFITEKTEKTQDNADKTSHAHKGIPLFAFLGFLLLLFVIYLILSYRASLPYSDLSKQQKEALLRARKNIEVSKKIFGKLGKGGETPRWNGLEEEDFCVFSAAVINAIDMVAEQAEQEVASQVSAGGGRISSQRERRISEKKSSQRKSTQEEIQQTQLDTLRKHIAIEENRKRRALMSKIEVAVLRESMYFSSKEKPSTMEKSPTTKEGRETVMNNVHHEPRQGEERRRVSDSSDLFSEHESDDSELDDGFQFDYFAVMSGEGDAFGGDGWSDENANHQEQWATSDFMDETEKKFGVRESQQFRESQVKIMKEEAFVGQDVEDWFAEAGVDTPVSKPIPAPAPTDQDISSHERESVVPRVLPAKKVSPTSVIPVSRGSSKSSSIIAASTSRARASRDVSSPSESSYNDDDDENNTENNTLFEDSDGNSDGDEDDVLENAEDKAAELDKLLFKDTEQAKSALKANLKAGAKISGIVTHKAEAVEAERRRKMAEDTLAGTGDRSKRR